MAAQYIQMGVTTIYVFLFLTGRIRRFIYCPEEAPSLHPVLVWISTPIKACIRTNVEFARALSLGLCIAVIITSYDDRYSSHSMSAGTFAASAFSISFLLLEFISWEWCGIYDARYAVVPVLFLIPFLTLVGIANGQKDVKMGNSNQFYRLCFDFERVNALADKMHYIVLGHAVLVVGFFVAWLWQRVSRWRRDRNDAAMVADGGGGAGRVEIFFQICIVVLTMSAQTVLVYSFVAYQKMVASVVGEQDPESQWTLGQILSVTAWIPAMAEFVAIISSSGEYLGTVRLNHEQDYIFFDADLVPDGLEKTWGWRLLKGWEIRETSPRGNERELEVLHPRDRAATPPACSESQGVSPPPVPVP